MVTCHDHLDATIQFCSLPTGENPREIAQMFSQSGSYSLTVSYIEAQLKKIPLGWVDAFTIDLYPADVRKTFAGASLSNSERQEERGGGAICV